jgi:hypothetical protein
LFLELVEHDIILWTATPKRRYTKESLGDLGGLIEPILHMVRAHEESLRKSQLLRAVWAKKKRQAIAGTPTPSRRPAWVDLVEGQFVVTPEKQATICKIFALAREGLGASRIAAWLCAHRAAYAPWGPSGTWQTEYVAKILRDRRTLGEYSPGEVDSEGHYRIGEKVVKGYFPVLVTEEDWTIAQAATRARRRKSGRAGEKEANLFTGVAYDAVNGNRLSVRCSCIKGKGRYRYLQARTQGGQKWAPRRCRYEQAEYGILDAIRVLRPSDVLPPERAAYKLEKKITELTGRLSAISARVELVQGQIADPMIEKDLVPPLMETLRRLAADRVETAQELQKLKLQSQTGRGEALGAVQSLLQLLHKVRGTSEEELIRRRIKAGLGRMVEGVWLLPQQVTERKQVLHVQIYLIGGKKKYIRIPPIKQAGDKFLVRSLPPGINLWDLRDCDFRIGEIGDIAADARRAQGV